MIVVPLWGLEQTRQPLSFGGMITVSGTMMGYDVSSCPFGFLSVSLFLSFSVVLLCVYFTAAYTYYYLYTIQFWFFKSFGPVMTMVIWVIFNGFSASESSHL